jgi:hypothetical protein
MIAYRIVAVPEREERAHALAVAVGGQVVLDVNHDGAFPNHVRALQSAGDATHLVVLEDDAILCDDFTQHVARLIEERPDHLLGLYVGRMFPKRPQAMIGQLVMSEPRWLDHPQVTDRLRWGVGYVMPVKDLPAVLAHLETVPQHPWIDTDGRIGRWHAERGLLSYPYPSPVDHDDNLPSTTSQHETGRVAWAHCQEGRA